MSIIIKPIVTEKMTKISEKLNQFAFQVNPDANKIQIKLAVESLYNVAVVDVNTIVSKGKVRTRSTKAGIVAGRTNKVKKAIVTLKEGDTIDFYSNI